MSNNIGRFIRTIYYLKWEQIFYRVRYKLLPINLKIDISENVFNTTRVKFIGEVRGFNNVINSKEFSFLNLQHSFNEKIDWNFNKFGKLWTYNLNYFGFLFDKNIDKNEAKNLIEQFINSWDEIVEGREPYPTSIRVINWIRFLSINNITDNHVLCHLYGQIKTLNKRIEYQILGNHLLENAFALLHGGAFFNNNKWKKKAEQIIRKEINEQILNDGMHFERSTMYHSIILFRVLESIDLLITNSIPESDSFLKLLNEKASLMIGCISKIANKDNSLPLLNDSANYITYTPAELIFYATSLGIKPTEIILNDCGFRRISIGKFDLLINIGNIISSYQPAHSHADTFSFELFYSGNPIIIDPGISTYDIGDRRSIERSTLCHNTVSVYGENSSEVWGGFRVGRRAFVNNIFESKNAIAASHNGYRHLKVFHKRIFEILENTIFISDNLEGKIVSESFFSIHFHPSCKIQCINNSVFVNEYLQINFKGFIDVKKEEYLYTPSYNTFIPSIKVIGIFLKQCEIEIKQNDKN